LRLATLAHLGRSVSTSPPSGPRSGHLELTAGDSVVVVGPETGLEVIAAREMRAHLWASGPGRYVVFDPAPLRRSLAAWRSDSTPTTLDERRSA
jgi:hypothetical protein